MNLTTRVGSVAGLVAAAALSVAGPAAASTASAPQASLPAHHRFAHSVFVQTDNPQGNAVVAYRRADDGALTLAHAYATGGLGGALTGSVVDHLASQGSLAYDRAHGLLYAVNAGSDTVSVFAVDGDRLHLRQVIGSGGSFPVSVSVHDDLVYVLNALDGGSIQGFRLDEGWLVRVPRWHRGLGLDPAATPQFTHTPGQVAFTPGGEDLLVTTKAGSDSVDVFGVRPSGAPSAKPVVTSRPGTVPFAIAFDVFGHVAIAEAGTNSVTTFAVNANRTLTPLATAGTGQAATCWVVAAGNRLYVSNAGSASLTGLLSGPLGGLAVLGNTATDAGTVDAAVTPGHRFLYVQAGKDGVVDAFRINEDGSLTALGSVTVPGGAGGEGIVAP